MSSLEFRQAPNRTNETPTIVMPSILAGAEHGTDGKLGDLGQRAGWMAEALNANVISVQRTTPDDTAQKRFNGLPKALTTAEYVQGVNRTAQKISDLLSRHGAMGELHLFGASAGGSYGLELARTERLPFEAIALFDPNAMRRLHTKFGAVAGWAGRLGVQRKLASRRGDPFANKNGLGYDLTPPVGPLQDMGLHENIWKSNRSQGTLTELASGGLLPNATTRLWIPKATFTDSAAHHQATVQRLNGLAEASGTDFHAQITEMPHWATDDPARTTKLMAETLDARHSSK